MVWEAYRYHIRSDLVYTISYFTYSHMPSRLTSLCTLISHAGVIDGGEAIETSHHLTFYLFALTQLSLPSSLSSLFVPDGQQPKGSGAADGDTPIFIKSQVRDSSAQSNSQNQFPLRCYDPCYDLCCDPCFEHAVIFTSGGSGGLEGRFQIPQ